MEHTGLRRRLRQDSTPAERVLWSRLRGRQLSGFKFRRQHSLHPYIVDFYCAAARLAIELDGEHHAEPYQREYDRARSFVFAQERVSVLRFTNRQVLADTDAVVSAIRRHVLGPTPALST